MQAAFRLPPHRIKILVHGNTCEAEQTDRYPPTHLPSFVSLEDLLHQRKVFFRSMLFFLKRWQFDVKISLQSLDERHVGGRRLTSRANRILVMSSNQLPIQLEGIQQQRAVNGYLGIRILVPL